MKLPEETWSKKAPKNPACLSRTLLKNLTSTGESKCFKMSVNRKKEISLSEKLSSLIQAKPSAIESDEDDFMTVSKIGPNDNDSEYSADELDISKFRRLNSGLLEEDDKKYLGKGISRKDLDSDKQSDISESDEDSENENHDSMSEKSDSENEGNVDEETNESEEEIESFENEKKNKIKPKKKAKEENINKEIFKKAASDIEKGKAIKNQFHIWDFLLECRMKFQKCVTASNQFPSHENFNKFKSKGDPTFQESVAECKKSLKHLLNSFLSLQYVLLSSNNDFLNSGKNTESKEITDDEEISSDTDKEIGEKECKFSAGKIKNSKDFSSELEKRHVNFQSYRNSVIEKWNDKTRIGYISNKNFSAFEQSTLKQIEHVLLDKERLIKRTQTKRSNYHILGEEDDQEPVQKKQAKSENFPESSLQNKSKDLHKEIFDDSDFYHQLLSDLVKRKANDVTDPIQLGRQWMQLQKIRSKMKKSVDTKASKGRKVRFVVHPKLVNFMMPINESSYNDDSKTELFNSLFGKAKK